MSSVQLALWVILTANNLKTGSVCNALKGHFSMLLANASFLTHSANDSMPSKRDAKNAILGLVWIMTHILVRRVILLLSTPTVNHSKIMNVSSALSGSTRMSMEYASKSILTVVFIIRPMDNATAAMRAINSLTGGVKKIRLLWAIPTAQSGRMVCVWNVHSAHTLVQPAAVLWLTHFARLGMIELELAEVATLHSK